MTTRPDVATAPASVAAEHGRQAFVGPAPRERGKESQLLAAEPVSDQVCHIQGHRPILLEDERRRPAAFFDPCREFGCVGNRCRETHERDAPVEVDDDLLPYRTSFPILQVVDLVQHDHGHVVEIWTVRVHHVPQDLGGHDDDGCRSIDRIVSREESDTVRAVPGLELAELLVGEGFDRCRVHRSGARLESAVYRRFGYCRLAGSGGGGDDDRLAAIDRLGGGDLETIGLEVEPLQVGDRAQRRRVKRTIQIVTS